MQIKPFAALRPVKERAADIAALPYDVQSTEEARVIVEENPLSFLCIDEPVVNFPEGTDPYAFRVYTKAGDLLGALESFGLMHQDETAGYYLYELTMRGRVQTGLVACVSIDDYLNGVVKEHESTRVDKEIDRINHIRGCKAQTGPIFLAYNHDDELARIYREAKQGESLFDFVADDGVRHRGFAIPRAEASLVEARCATMKRVYIADGHHRVAAASEIAKALRKAKGTAPGELESDWFLAVMFPDSELEILPYDRVVRDLNGLSESEFLAELQARFEVKPVPDLPTGEPFSVLAAENREAAERALRPTEVGVFATFLGGRWYICRVRPEDMPDYSHVTGRLEVSLLQRMLFQPVLGIADPRRSPRIDFVGGIRGIAELERRCQQDCVAAFALSPTRIVELFAVADAGRLMPPKSTWFEPKLRSGLFIHKL